MKPITDDERIALKTAISRYIEEDRLLLACKSTDAFLSFIPGMTTRRLTALVKHHGREIGEMAGAKNIRINKSKSRQVKPSLTFLY